MGVQLGRRVSAHPLTVEHIMKLHDSGLNYSQIARELEASEIPTPRGGKRWYVTTVRDIILRGS